MMMIEPEWFTSIHNHHPNLKKSIALLLHIVLILISAGIESCCVKSGWVYRVVITGDYVLFLSP